MAVQCCGTDRPVIAGSAYSAHREEGYFQWLWMMLGSMGKWRSTPRPPKAVTVEQIIIGCLPACVVQLVGGGRL